MKAIILSAGQGKRLLPLTTDLPKCLLSVRGKTLIEWQIHELQKCGVRRIRVVTGYCAELVDQLLRERYASEEISTIYNDAYATTDNLVSCWTACGEMNEDFIILNGDTIFEAAVLNRLLESPDRPVTVAVNHKGVYDADDMKVMLEGERLVRIGKDLQREKVHAESIGMILFRGKGPALFRRSLQKAFEEPSAGKKWYLSVIDEMARQMPVWTCAVNGLQWCEVDYRADIEHAVRVVGACGDHDDASGAVCRLVKAVPF
ncbi:MULTISPECIES: NTP transferase domain-containing protein [Desulfococcus]|jgi:choline kinase|uniref:MobA-like NTP transferase domain containing protein n=1 Tax=Desulfococcus multivorans DSM 2059 TaxID=1121405 RepID=S7V436_DESML|nr:phosphocholine cytidylyltransferase family protein [Desulfococcus multivorans]AOY58128.1 nucleotidyl transferase [Desulfococcus multivorans]AQV00483.1 nucleotidyltransferase [Desulfococcus multivorans]EPR41304.1 MobA-like NTP transferase domain containing protein [Desulfococcus multivorans DSM 2059]MDX9819229.1 phosphocholine cytidylyltransferase family protein [Desulfococcus multivorans]SJZ73332.1 Choline kinase [Desulfococcus multivorans DSM 2059]